MTGKSLSNSRILTLTTEFEEQKSEFHGVVFDD